MRQPRRNLARASRRTDTLVRRALSSAAPLLFYAAALLLLSASGALAQERLTQSQWKRGYHGFAGVCQAMGVELAADRRAWRRAPAAETIMMVFGEPDRLPVDLHDYLHRGGGVMIASDRGGRSDLFNLGVHLIEGSQSAARRDDAFRGYLDCPLVSDFDAGPQLTRGVRTVATNRPGAIHAFGGARPPGFEDMEMRVLARFPRLRGFRRRSAFMVGLRTSQGGQAVVLADQSVLANQMLFHEDNALLAANIVRWFKAEGRTTVLLVGEDTVAAPSLPEEVEVELPPPTPEEVRDALRQLPPDVLLDFGNAVAATMEDEGMANDFLRYLVEKIPRRSYDRMLVLLASLLLVVVATRRVFASAHVDDAQLQADDAPAPTPRDRAARQRRRAAGELVQGFRAELAGESAASLEEFLARLESPGRPGLARGVGRKLKSWESRLENDRYWTPRRLQQLQRQIDQWRRLHASGELVYRAPA